MHEDEYPSIAQIPVAVGPVEGVRIGGSWVYWTGVMRDANFAESLFHALE
jgi:hypothetical protein